MKWVSRFAVAVAVAALWACGGGSGQTTGSLRVRAGSQAMMAPAGVDHVTVAISRVAGGWEPVRHDVFAGGTGEYSFVLDEIPVGQFRVYAEARDAADAVLFWLPEDLVVDVLAHQTAEVTLNLQEKNHHDPYSNGAPYIVSLTTTSDKIDKATAISLAATVARHDGALRFKWFDNFAGGTFSAPHDLQTTWTPPGNGNFVLTFSATDEDLAIAALSVTIQVADEHGKGGIGAVLDFNNWPIVERISAFNAQGVVGVPMMLVAKASDADNDEIRFQWETACGSLEDPAADAVVPEAAEKGFPRHHYSMKIFTPPAEGLCTIGVTVTDYADHELTRARMGSGTGTFTFNVGQVKAAVGPQFYIRISTPRTLMPGERADVQVIPIAKISEWTYAWSDGDLGGLFEKRLDRGFEDGSDHWYTAPQCGEARGEVTLPMSVVVTDTATGAVNAEAFELKLLCPEAT